MAGWVLVRESPEVGPAYWNGKPDSRAWTFDLRKAIVFARKQDAEEVRFWTLNDDKATSQELTEHGG